MSTRPSTSRLSTAGGIKYALVENFPQIKFTPDGGTAVEKYVIAVSDLSAFVTEAFPAPTFVLGFIQLGNRRRFPGNNFLISTEITAEAVDTTKPWDPFGNDPTAPENTYGQLCYVTIHYSTVGNEDDDEPDPQRPETFLTHSVNVGGEFLALNAPNNKWKNQVNADNSAGEQVLSEHPEFMDPLNLPGAVPDGEEDAVDGEIEENKDFQIPMTKVIPTIEHSLSWKEVIDPPWQAIRELLGKVNSNQVPLFFHAPPQTVLFLGVSAKQEFTARIGVPAIIRKPWTMDFKFSEKHGKDGGVVIGWNHFWRPEKNRFDILLRQPGNKRAYESGDFTKLFRRGHNPP